MSDFTDQSTYKHPFLYTGLSRDPEVRQKLVQAYRKILTELDRLPTDYFYRVQQIGVLSERIKWLQDERLSGESVEQQIGEGPLEEVLESTKDEELLVAKMVDWRPWEALAEKPPQGQWINQVNNA